MAADTLATDTWGAKEFVKDKIWIGDKVLLGCAGSSGEITKWLRQLPRDVPMEYLLNHGYAPFIKDANDPAMLVVDRVRGHLYRHVSGAFLRTSHKQWAVGSGRDYALAAMYLGKTAKQAVAIAMHFDNNTGGRIVEVRR